MKASPILLSSVSAEEEFLRKHDNESVTYRAHRAAVQYEVEIRKKYANQPDFFKWTPNRSLNRQDFDYLFWHRDQFNPPIRELLEIVAAKISHLKKNGEPGYFNKQEHNVGWTGFITPLILVRHSFALARLDPLIERIVRCGLWRNASNSRRCHKTDLCEFCLWNDIKRTLVQAFGSESPAFGRAPLWLFMTLSYTTQKSNSKAVFKVLEKEDYAVPRGDGFSKSGLFGGAYDPHPVQLTDDTGDAPWWGLEESRVLFLIAQEAVESFYPDLLDGYKTKLEAAFSLVVGKGISCLPHLHGVANASRDTNGRYFAELLFENMKAGLTKYRRFLDRKYYPDVKLFSIPTPVDLERVLMYMEKVVPIGLIVGGAMGHPDAKTPDGKWSESYACQTEKLLNSLLDEITENLFGGFELDDELYHLRRRKTVGNMVFNDHGTCIGDEPDLHAKMRRNNAEKARKKREEKREQEQKQTREMRLSRRQMTTPVQIPFSSPAKIQASS